MIWFGVDGTLMQFGVNVNTEGNLLDRINNTDMDYSWVVGKKPTNTGGNDPSYWNDDTWSNI